MQLYFKKQKVIFVVKTHNEENTQTVAMSLLEFILQHYCVLNYKKKKKKVLNISQRGTSSSSCILLNSFRFQGKKTFF